MKLHFPTKKFFVTQKWGNLNPMYRANGFDMDRHNGIDFVAKTHRTNFPVFCPADGFKVVLVRNVPKGGGNEVWLMSKEKHQVGDKFCYLYMVFCHADKVLVSVGEEPKVGSLLLISDNTGFSTGEHCHWGLYRVDYDGRNIIYLDENDANGSYDPSSLLTGEYAVDKATLGTLINNGFRIFGYYATK